MTHLPPHWRERVLWLVAGRVNDANLALLDAWQRAEGGDAKWNPLNTTLALPGSTPYNDVGVQNFRRAVDGLAATGMTIANGRYPGILRDLQHGSKSATQIVNDNAAEFNLWGTGAKHIAALLATVAN